MLFLQKNYACFFKSNQWFSSIHYIKRHEAYILINDFEIEFYKLWRHPHSRNESKNDHKIKFSVRGTAFSDNFAG